MKKIEATLKPVDLEGVRQALADEGVWSLLALQATCLGEKFSTRRVHRGSSYVVDSMPFIRLEVVVADDQVDRIVGVIKANAGPTLPAEILVIQVE